MKNLKQIVDFAKQENIENIAVSYTTESNDFKEELIVIPFNAFYSAYKKAKGLKNTLLNIGKDIAIQDFGERSDGTRGVKRFIGLKIKNKIFEQITFERSFINPFFARKTLVLLANHKEKDYSCKQTTSSFTITCQASESTNSMQDYINEVVAVLNQTNTNVAYSHVTNIKDGYSCFFELCENNSNEYNLIDNKRKFTYIAGVLAEIFNKQIQIN